MSSAPNARQPCRMHSASRPGPCLRRAAATWRPCAVRQSFLPPVSQRRNVCVAVQHGSSSSAQPQPSRQHGWLRRPHTARVQGAAAGATAQSAASHASDTHQSWGEAWRAWWSVAPAAASEPAPGSAPPQSLKRVAAKLWKVLNINKLMLFGALLFMVLASLSELAILHLTSASIFAVTKAGSESLFQYNIQLLCACAVCYGVTAGLRGYLFSVINADLIQNLRGELFSSILRQPVEFFDDAEVGVLTSRLGNDCQVVVKCVSTNINVALRNSLQCIGGGVYLFLLSRELFAACVASTVILWLVALRFGSYSRKAQRSYQDTLADTNQVAEEVFTLSRVVRTFGTEDREVNRYMRNLGRLRRISVRLATAYLLYLVMNASLFNLTKAMALLLGGGMALAGRITAQQLTSFYLYTDFVVVASLSVCDQWGSIMESVGASERVMDYLDRQPAAQLNSGATLPSFSGRIELWDVTYVYPSRPKAPALRGVSLSLEPGRLIALVGLSGSGKSTLVAMLERLYDPTSGQVLADGVDLRQLDAGWLRSQLGVVSQDPRLFSESVAANIAYGLPGKSQADIEEAARLANAHSFICALPQGYATQVTDKLLSGGQRQRLSLARAIIRKPKVLILDEATSALDVESEAQVQAALDRAMRATGRSVLVIAHRLSTVRTADRIVVMDAGRVAEEGTHAELARAGGIYSHLLRRQSGGLAPPPDLAPSDKPQEAEPKAQSSQQSVDDPEAYELAGVDQHEAGGKRTKPRRQ